MPRETDYWFHHSVNCERFIEVTTGGQLNQHLEEPVSPLVEEFARTLAVPMIAWREHFGEHRQMMPSELTGNTLSLLEFVRTKGRDNNISFSRYVSPRLIEANEQQIEELYLAVPGIVRACFPADFAEDVEQSWDEQLKYWGYKEDLPSKMVEEIEPIDEPITSAAEAKRQIIDYARAKVLALDWEWASGFDMDQAVLGHSFDMHCIRALSGVSMAPVVNVLDHTKDAAALAAMTADRKVELNDQTSLTLAFDAIDAPDATFLRDLLCVTVTDDIAERCGPQPVSGKLLMGNPGLQQALGRMVNYSRFLDRPTHPDDR